MEARTLQPLLNKLCSKDQPSMKLIFVSYAQKNRIIYRSDEVHGREIVFRNFFLENKL